MNKKIKLLRNFILLSIPLVVLCIMAYILPMSYMSTEYVMWDEEYENSAAPYIDTKTVIIGDSRAKSSILPAKLHENTYNIGIGGATPIEMYYATKNYIEHNGAPENAIVIFAPYHLCDIDNWDQALYFNFLSVKDLAEIYGEALDKGDSVVTRKGRIPEMISYKLRLPSKYLAQMYDAKIIGNKNANKARFDSIRADYGYLEFGSADGDYGENYEVHHEYFDSSRLVLSYYVRLIDLLDENDVNIIIAQAPINEASSEAIHQEFLDGYKAYMEHVAHRLRYHSMRVIYDIPVYPNELYGDANHLNKKGAERYTEELKEYLESIDFWK